MSDFSTDDIRAAVNANILNEAQASNLLTLAQTRQGTRGHLPSEDEPFEFFRGFSEIFITVGLCLLFSGLMAFSAVFSSGIVSLVFGAILCLIFASYFTLKRRMSLPSIALATGFAVFLASTTITLFGSDELSATDWMITGLIGMGAMLGYFYFFKLPFSMFIFGIFGMLTIYAAIATTGDELQWFDFPEALFDLSKGPYALGSLLFGLCLFAIGLYFDTKDPNRLTRYSSTGFWLHIIAAPAIVNTAALSILQVGNTASMLATALLLLVITLLSLIIDRRSFLTAGILYLGFLIGWVFSQGMEDGVGLVFTLLLLGVFITSLGTWWVQIRARLMRTLPNFPYKDRLPPYSEPT